MRQPRTVYGGLARTGAPVTWGLVAVNVAIFLITAVGGTDLGLSLSGAADTSPLYRQFELVPYLVAQGGYYRLISAMFLHYGLLHILFNMWALAYIGPSLESSLGRTRFAALYLLAGLGGSVATYSFGPVFEASAGASGAIFGLFGAYFIFARHQRRDTRVIIALIVINLILSFSVPGIDFRAHLGGLATGAVVGVVLAYAPRGRYQLPVQVLGSVLVAVILVGGAAARTHSLHSAPPPIGNAQAGRHASTAATTWRAGTPRRKAETT
ncbi:MAG: rhomboid family intramembrane serine protease [Mycobacteriales bacterium]